MPRTALTKQPTYPFEDIRNFLVRRQWFVSERLLSGDEYTKLLSRELVISRNRAAIIRAFMEGYLYAKG